MPRLLTSWLVLVLCIAAGCADANAPPEPLWTVRQAESITSVRGMPVRVRHCRGLGRGRRGEGAIRYRSFDCLAGGRAVSDPYDFDTVGVLYVLHPLGEYEGPRSEHRLTNVRFIGGPGIP